MALPFHPQRVWLVTASFLAGALNAVAGGGSFLSFPAILGAGVLPVPANATNTVALWPGQITSIAAYRDDLSHNLRLLLPVCGCALLGGLGGAIMLLHTGQRTFLRVVPWLLLAAALLFAASEPIGRAIAQRRVDAAQPTHLHYLPLCTALLVISLYIGYFGAGGGILIMASLAIFGIRRIREINALKVVATTVGNGIAVATFIVERQVVWHLCLLMMLTAAFGGYLGGHYSRYVNPHIIRICVVIIGLAMAAYFFVRMP